MNLLRSLRRKRAQTASEYMLMISVIAIGLYVITAAWSDPGGPVQQGTDTLVQDLENSLSNDRTMQVE